jgi:hypothetical protein
MAIFISKIINYFTGPYNPEKDKQKSTNIIGLELCGIIWLMGVCTYLVRNIVEIIPSPFEDVFNFHHHRVKELSSAAVFTLILYQSLYVFKGKLETYINRNY